MSDISTSEQGDALVVEFDEGLYPKDAIYGAAYIFIDRCYVHLDRPKEGRVAVRLKSKPGASVKLAELAGEFENELLGQAWRRMIIDENRSLIEEVTMQGLVGAAGPPGLDDLLNMEIDDESAFEDPLGIAMSWEEKYKKKGTPKAEGDDPVNSKAAEEPG